MDARGRGGDVSDAGVAAPRSVQPDYLYYMLRKLEIYKLRAD
jgi:hypothetical protein